MTSFGGLSTFKPEDNANASGKLTLRRYVHDRYHRDTTPVVLDCCQAEMKLWGTLRQEYDVRYWGVDKVKKPGRLTIDSTRLLNKRGLPYDVIDVDTYGSPWVHWVTMLPNLVKPTTVFLTVGRVGAITAIDRAVLDALGLLKVAAHIPRSLWWKLSELALDACLAKSYHYQVHNTEALEVIPESPNARYFGFRLQPLTSRV